MFLADVPLEIRICTSVFNIRNKIAFLPLEPHTLGMHNDRRSYRIASKWTRIILFYLKVLLTAV